MVPATEEQMIAWKNGTLIQKAMPNLGPAERELILSQTCDACWQKLWSDEDGQL